MNPINILTHMPTLPLAAMRIVNQAVVGRTLAAIMRVQLRALSSSLCSDRGRDSVGLLPSYLADARSVLRYSIDHPEGALQLGVAETQLMQDWLLPALNAAVDIPTDAIYYQPTAGREDCQNAVARYAERLLGLSPNRLDTDGLVVGAGCNAVLENLCFCLASPGDAVLIPTPYYAAFEFDLVARAQLFVEPVTTQHYHTTTNPIDPTIYYPTATALDAAYRRAQQAGHPPRILLLSHPQNPLGICYPPSVVQECIDWCRQRQVHLISDEIYAGSVYHKNANFVSAISIASADQNNCMGPYVHWVYALSKDFGLSGLRVGAVYTENNEIRLPLQKLNDLCQISSSTQLWTQATLTRSVDTGELWTDAFRRENHRRLSDRQKRLTECLDDCALPYLDPTSGLFVWIDFSDHLPAGDLTPGEQERQLYLELVKEHGLLLTPGWSMRNEKPGFFRCVFTAANDAEFDVAIQRLNRFYESRRRRRRR